MKATNQTLGRALAQWQAQHMNTLEQIPEDQNDHIRLIDRRYLELKNDSKMQSLMASLPQGACSYEQPFLKDNQDFFITLFSEWRDDHACIKLYEHLNSCYYCFEIMSEVLREYYLQKQELEAEKGGGNNG